MPKKLIARIVFLGLTALTLGTEIAFSFDQSDDTEPWTQLIVNHIPGEITAAALGALCLWLLVHFGVRYKREWSAYRILGQLDKQAGLENPDVGADDGMP